MESVGTARVEPAQLDMAKAHPPVAIGDFLEADAFAGQGLIDIHAAPAPADLPIGQGAADHIRSGIDELGQALRKGAGRRLIGGRWGLLAQRLVRPLVIVDRSKAIECALLRSARPPRRLDGLLFERAVHALMLRVLLGIAGGNALRVNTQAEPPDS